MVRKRAGGGGAPVDDTRVTNDSADKLAKAMSACRDQLLRIEGTTTVPSTEATIPIGNTTTAAAALSTCGPETRTSSPIRVTRDDTFRAVRNDCLYPCGEGAGYAGGIVSAAVDGLHVAEAIIARFRKA